MEPDVLDLIISMSCPARKTASPQPCARSVLEALVSAERPAGLLQAPVSRMPMKQALAHLPSLRRAAAAMADKL